MNTQITNCMIPAPRSRWLRLYAPVLLVAGLAGLGGCADDRPPQPSGNVPPGDPQLHYTVHVTAVDIAEPVSLELHYRGITESLSVSADGSFAFQALLVDGEPFAVSLADEAPCVVQGGTGTIDGADPEVTLACGGPVLLTDLFVDGFSSPELGFSPERQEYRIDVPLSQQTISVTAVTFSPEATLTMSGMPMESGIPSAELPLDLGSTAIAIQVSHPTGLVRTYRIVVNRAGKLAQSAYGKASNTDAFDGLGFSMAVWGDILAVGAWSEDSAATGMDGNQADNSASGSGAVYIFRRRNTTWTQEAYIKPSNTGEGDGFGFSVALWGDTLAVGAWNEDSAATGVGGIQADDYSLDSGAVYVFRRRSTAWIQEAYIKASNTGEDDWFGHSVSLSGDTLAVGAPGESSAATGVGGNQPDDSTGDSGAVYVFRRSGAAWAQEAYIKASNTGAGDRFGSSVALWGETLVVGAPGEASEATGVNGDDADTAPGSGATYVFHRNGAAWAQQAYIKASNTGAGDRFGSSVAIWGDTIAVGAWNEDSSATGVNNSQTNDSAPDSGAVYVFRKSDTTWAQEAYLKATNTGAGDYFGESVVLWSDTLAVGAPGEASAATGVDGSQGDDRAEASGAVYLFRRDGTTWARSAYVKASNTDAGDRFGSSVALSDNTLAAGAIWEESASTGVDGNQDDNRLSDSGAIYIFH